MSDGDRVLSVGFGKSKTSEGKGVSRFIPRGVAVANLGRRIVAAIVDLLPVGLIVGGWYAVHALMDSTTASFVGGVIAAVLLAGYLLYQWWAYGSRGAGLGARLTGIRVVGINSGEPIGWWRFFLRQLVFFGLMITIIGGIVLLVFTGIHERRQGWHDMASRAVVVQPKHDTKRQRVAAKRSGASSTVGLPPHLSSAFAPGGSQDYSTWAPQEPPQTRPDWMPHLETQPLAQPEPQMMSGQDGARSFGHGIPAPQPSGPSHAQPQSSAAPQPQRSAAPQPQPSAPPQPQPSANRGWIPLPSASSVIEPPRPEPRVRERSFEQADTGEDGTHLARPGGPSPEDGGAWYIRLDDGREVELTVSVLLGRNPQKSPTDPDVHLVPAGGDGRMISRTHVLIGVDDRGAFIQDRGSTNGTAIVMPDGQLDPCPEGTRIRVRSGQQVSYGDRWFTVLRHPAPAVR